MQIFHPLKTSLFLALQIGLVRYPVFFLFFSVNLFPFLPEVRNEVQLVLQKINQRVNNIACYVFPLLMKKKIKLCNIIIFGIHPMILDLAADVFQLFLTQNSFENVKSSLFSPQEVPWAQTSKPLNAEILLNRILFEPLLTSFLKVEKKQSNWPCW